MTAAVIFLALGLGLGWHVRSAHGALDEVRSLRAKLPRFRRAYRKHSLRSLLLAAVIIVLAIGIIQGRH